MQIIRPGETLQVHPPSEMAIPSLADVEEFDPAGYDQAKVLALPFPIPNAVLFETEAEEAGPLTVEAASLDFDTAIRISRAGPEGEATILKADDDSGTGSNSRLVIKAEAGDRYRIEVFRLKLPDVVTAGSEFEISVRAGKPERQGLA